MKQILIGILLILYIAGLVACTEAPEGGRPDVLEMDEKAEILKTPESTEGTNADKAPDGDEFSAQRVNVALYFPNKDKTKLVTKVKKVLLGKNETTQEVAVKELLKGPEDDNLSEIFPEDLRLKRFSQAENIATVNFNKAFLKLEGYDEFLAVACIVNTLTEFEDIKYVSIFVDDKELGSKGKPYGPLTKTTGDIQALWANRQKEQEKEEAIAKDKDSNQLTKKDVVLYFQDPMAQYLLPEVRNIQIVGTKYVAAIVNELVKGPKDARMYASLPKDLELKNDPVLAEDEEGKTFITLNFSEELKEYVQDGSTSEILSLGAIVHSITDFMPDIDYIKVLIEGERIDRITDHISAPGGKLFKEDFMHILGKRILIYFTDKEATGLIPVYRAVPKSDMRYARMIMEELIRGPYNREYPDARPVISQGISSKDISGIAVEKDLVKLNLSRNFYEKSRGLGLAGESMLVFSIVNSLTELSNVKRVQFFIEGKTVETFSGHIDISAPLIRNPGIINQNSKK
ncbi:MAG: GerMN domain-containing protein [Clostridia bacterium]